MKPYGTPGKVLASGFTLVEILLALTLMSMLLALAYGGLRASTRAANKGQVILEDSGRIRMAHQFVRRQLNQMLPLGFDETEEGERTVFEGAAQKIRYVSPMPGYLGFGGPHVQELALIPDEEGYVLVLSHALLQGFEEERLYDRDPIVLLENIENAEFAFLGLDEEGNLSTWVNQWAVTSILPESVSLDIEFNKQVYIGWPLLTASVRIDASALEELVVESGADQPFDASIRSLIEKRKQKQ